MTWTIASDSGCDINYLKEESIEYKRVPYRIEIGNFEFVDTQDADIQKFQAMLDQNKGKTSSACPGPGDWVDVMEQGDYILTFTISSAVSGSYNSANIAKDMILEKYPDKKIYVFDSLCGSGKTTLLINYAVELIKKGLSFEEICKNVNDYSKKTEIFFILQHVDNLVSNGRLNAVIGKAISKMKLQLIATVTEKGTLGVINKSRDFNKSVAKCIDEIIKKGYNGGKVIVSHCLNPKGAEIFKAAVLEKFPMAHIAIMQTSGLCGYYAEKGGLTIGVETLN